MSSKSPALRSAGSGFDRRERLIDAFMARSGEVVIETVREMRKRIPGYRGIDDEAFFADVSRHVSDHHGVFVECLRAGREIEPEDLLFVRSVATRRATRRLPLADFLLAYRIGQQVIWETILEIALAEGLASEALDLVMPVFHHQAKTSTLATEVYVEVEQQHAVAGEQVKRDLLEDLLAGRRPANGLRREAAVAAGIEAATPCVVVVACSSAVHEDQHALHGAAGVLARAHGGARAPLSVVRGDEIVIIVPTDNPELAGFIERLREAHDKLADRNVGLAIGISTVVDAGEGLPAGYAEAIDAAERAPGGGVVALSELSAFEYLTLSMSDTTLRLLPAEVLQFAEEDLSKGGVIADTLREFLAADFNATLAAERLHVHVNTMHYRLRKVEERTGLDVRRVSHVNELVIAITGIRERSSRR